MMNVCDQEEAPSIHKYTNLAKPDPTSDGSGTWPARLSEANFALTEPA